MSSYLPTSPVHLGRGGDSVRQPARQPARALSHVAAPPPLPTVLCLCLFNCHLIHLSSHKYLLSSHEISPFRNIIELTKVKVKLSLEVKVGTSRSVTSQSQVSHGVTSKGKNPKAKLLSCCVDLLLLKHIIWLNLY